MKKAIIFFSFLILSTYVNAQDVLPIDEESGKVTFTEVVQVDNNTQIQLFNKATNFGTLKKENIIKESAEEGIYKTKGRINVKYPSPMRGMNHDGFVDYTVEIMVKDGRYKYTFTDFVHSSPKGDGGKLEGSIPECGKYTLVPGGWAVIKRETKSEMEKIVENLKSQMSVVPKESKAKNDW